jgi:hypothetical protein
VATVTAGAVENHDAVVTATGGGVVTIDAEAHEAASPAFDAVVNATGGGVVVISAAVVDPSRSVTPASGGGRVRPFIPPVFDILADDEDVILMLYAA